MRPGVQPLTGSGQEFLRRLWLRGCQDRLLEENVRIDYATRLDP